jgi:hypothetical protein
VRCEGFFCTPNSKGYSKETMEHQGDAGDSVPFTLHPATAGPPSLVRVKLARTSGGSLPASGPSSQQACAPEAMVWSQGPCPEGGPEQAHTSKLTALTAEPAFENGARSFSQPPVAAGEAAAAEQAHPLACDVDPRLSGKASGIRRSGQSTGRGSGRAEAAAAPVDQPPRGTSTGEARAADEEEDERIPITGKQPCYNCTHTVTDTVCQHTPVAPQLQGGALSFTVHLICLTR